jgi:hypothetical protein
MFIRFREVKAERYDGNRAGPEDRICAGECKDRPRYHAARGFYVPGHTFLKGCPLKPICPLANPTVRLEVSIVATRREDGKVKHTHVASLGSIVGDSLRGRDTFWNECKVRLVRLANRLGPDADRLRQVIAARIPPLTDTDRMALDAEAWDSLEGMWDNFAKRKARESSQYNEYAKVLRREAQEADAIVLQTKRRDPEAYNDLNQLLGAMLAANLKH